MYPTLFRIPFLPDWLADVKSYGAAMTVAFLTGIWLACRRADRSRGNADVVLNIGFISLIFGVAGARAMFVLHYWDTRFANQPNPIAEIINIRAGGLEFWGGPLLAVPALAIYLKFIAKASVRWYLDMTAPSLAWGLAITRIGCFLNGCCWGGVCVDHNDPARLRAEYPWAVRFPYGSAPMQQQYRFGQLTLPKELIYVFERTGESIPLPAEAIHAALAEGDDKRAQLDAQYAEALKALKAANDAGMETDAYKKAKAREEAIRQARAAYELTGPGLVEKQCRKYNITVADLARLADFYRSKPVHPVQLYEMISAFIIAFLLARLYYYRRRHGIVLPWFLILYSISRVIHESIRQDNPLDVGGITISQAISIGTFTVGVVALALLYLKMPIASPRAVPFVYPDEAPAARPRA